MQAELDGESHPIEIRIVGVNAIGLESGNAQITMGRTLPWLQDTVDEAVWTSWGVTFRDVWVLGTANEPIAVYNLTANNLGDPQKYAELKAILIAASEGN